MPSRPTAASPGDDPNRLLTYGDVAEWLSVPERTVRKWAADGTGPRVLAVGRHRRIRVADVLTWLDTRYITDAA